MDIIQQGECGQDAKWSLTSENTLIISGEGRMKDYEIRSSYYDGGREPFMNVINDDYLVPWRDYSNDITQIIIEEGITYIGSFAFCNFQSLESVILPHSLSEIGICSFAVCPNLYDVKLNPQVIIAEWAFFGSPFVVTENEDTSFEISPERLEKLKERLDPKMEDFFNSIKKSSSHQNSDSPLIEEKYDICISHFGIMGHRTEVDLDGFPVNYIESLIPNDITRKQIRESWKGHFFYGVAEDYFQGLYLNSYNKERQLLNKEENNLAEIDNYYLSLLIRNAIIRYQYAQNTIKLLNEVTEENITDYAESRKMEISQIELGIKEPPKSSIAFRLGRLYEYLGNVLDSKITLSALGFDNVEQVSNWLSSGIDSVDGDILCSDKITLNNLVKAYLDCQKKILYENDRTKIAMWYLISNCKLTNHDYHSVDESYIGELRIKHQWLVNNLSFDILYRMMYPPEYGCEVDGWFDNVEVYLRKDVIDDYPLSSLYVEDELLRGANIYIHELLKRDGFGFYLHHEIYNDNKKNEILKYIGLSGGEDEEGVNSNAEYNPDVTAIDNSTCHGSAKLESDDKKTRYSELRKLPYYEQVKAFFSNIDIYDKKGLDENRKGQENQKASVYIRRFWEDIYYIAQKVEHKADLVGFMYILYESNCFNWSKMISILLDKMYDFYGNSDNTSIDSASDAKKQMKELERIFEDKEKPQWNEIRNYIQTMFNMMFMCDLKFEEINDNFKSHGIKYASSQFSKNNDMLDFADTFDYDLNTKELEKIKESRKKMNEKRKGERKYVSPHKRTTSYDENELSSENTQSC